MLRPETIKLDFGVHQRDKFKKIEIEEQYLNKIALPSEEFKRSFMNEGDDEESSMNSLKSD